MKTLPSVLFATAALGLIGCSSSGSDSDSKCNGGKCDELEGDRDPLDTPCDSALFDRSGRGFLPERLAEDALIKLVYMDDADGCPTTTKEIMEVLNKNDRRCDVDNGLTSHVISEQAQLNGTSEGASYRIVTSKACDGRPEFGLLMSMFGFSDTSFGEQAGLHPGGTELPGGLEVIAFDERNGVFNYYKEIDGRMGFFGSSTDFATQGAGGPNLTDIRGCANCHPKGRLVMKELENPWVHWEEVPEAGFTTFERLSPGAGELLENRRELLGARGDGPRLEQAIIKPGNEEVNERVVEFLADGESVQDLLRPLFCPEQLEIAATFNAGRLPHKMLVDKGLLETLTSLDGDDFLRADRGTYDTMLELTGSQVPGSDQLDVRQARAFVGRAHADIDYIEKLIDAGIIDREFANDVQMVDFTRQVFSNDRCDLLEFAPDLPPADRTADKIRDGFIDSLAGETGDSPEAQLLAHLENDQDDHEGTLDAFIEACEDRQAGNQFASTDSDFDDLLGASAFEIDVFKLRSLGRNIAMSDGVLDNARGSAERHFSLFEFGDSLSQADIEVVTSGFDALNPLEIHRRSRLDPIDCSLVDEFIGIETNAPEPTDGPSCEGICGEFVNGAECQCDDSCQDFGNCCDDFEALCL